MLAQASLTTSYLLHATVIPIPLHKNRERWRGFNQSEIIGKLIAKRLNLQFKNNLLIRPIATCPQVGLAKNQRVRNMRGKFAVNSSLKSIIQPQIAYIIFDDVLTTGSTIKEAIRILKESGAQKVFGLTIAR